MKSRCIDDDLKRSLRGTAALEKSLRKLMARPKKTNISEHGSSAFDIQLKNKIAGEIKALNAQKQQLFMDNQFLTHEVLKFKQEIHQLNKQIASLRKYVHFLQTYNEDLKQEMGIRIKKPKNMHNITVSQLTPQVLSKEIEHLRRMNDFKESQLRTLERENQGHSQPNKDNIAVISKRKHNNITPKKSVSYLQKNNPHSNSSKLKKPKPKHNKSHLTQNPPQCKSHNYPCHFPFPSDFLY